MDGPGTTTSVAGITPIAEVVDDIIIERTKIMKYGIRTC